MSATELIQQVAALPPQEKILFERLYRAMENDTRPPDKSSQPLWPDFTERLRGIYGDNVAPDSKGIIDEGRGEA